VGDDPVVVIEVAITNTASEAADVRWVEVFSSLMVQMDPNNFRLPGVDRRHFSTTHYASLFSPSAAGLSHARRWLGLTANESEFVQREINYTLPAGASVYDVAPPTSFASVLNPLAAQIAVGNDGHAFFGDGGPSAPSCGIQMNSSTEAHASLIISTPLTVEAGDVKKVYLIYGYTVPTDAPGKKEELIAKYEKLVSGNADLATLVAAEWQKKLTKLSIPSVPWLGAEVLWNSYYLQGGVTYDSFFQEHILNQGMTYQYSDGIQAAARDPLQHALPLVWTRPDLAKSILRYTLKEMMPTWHTVDPNKITNLPYAIIGNGVYSSSSDLKPDDMELYALLLAAEYLLATKDTSFLSEKVTFYGGREHCVHDALIRCLNFSVDGVGLGEHGIMRQLTSDWDDFFHPPAEAYNLSESVLTASLATYALDRFAQAMQLAGDADSASKASDFAEANRVNIYKHAFNGQWLRRAWFGPEAGWVGDINSTSDPKQPYPGIFSAQQGWAMAGGVFDDHPSEANTTIGNLRTHCRDGGWNYGDAARAACNMLHAARAHLNVCICTRSTKPHRAPALHCTTTVACRQPLLLRRATQRQAAAARRASPQPFCCRCRLGLGRRHDVVCDQSPDRNWPPAREPHSRSLDRVRAKFLELAGKNQS